MSKLKRVSRGELSAMIEAGRAFVWATLYERQDYMVTLDAHGHGAPVREITNEPNATKRRTIPAKKPSPLKVAHETEN